MIYTRGGDQGETGLPGGQRVKKSDPRIEVCGALDETSAALGLARALGLPERVDRVVAQVQEDLLLVGAEVAAPAVAGGRIGIADVARLESTIDMHEAELRPLRSFILPGGAPGGAALHLARSVCRRAERNLVAVAHEGEGDRLLVYLNRLSDLLFVLARHANSLAGATETTWGPDALRSRG